MATSTSPDGSSASEKSQRLLTATLVAGLIAAALALALFSWLGREILIGVTPVIDERVRAAVHDLSSPRLTKVMVAASLYGGPAWLAPLGAVLALGFFIRGWRRGAVLGVVTMAGAGLLDTLLKVAFARARPTAFFDYPLPVSHSFPSGHAFFAASFFGGLAVLASDRVRSKLLRSLIWLTAIGLILLVGMSRIYLGVHYPSDVLAGYAAATIWVTAVAFGDRLAGHQRRRLA
jgi:membrane-associated phospholipid phosphatase